MMRISVRATASLTRSTASMFDEMLLMPIRTSFSAIFGFEPAWPHIDVTTPALLQR
jgi:hypothetical protein